MTWHIFMSSLIYLLNEIQVTNGLCLLRIYSFFLEGLVIHVFLSSIQKTQLFCFAFYYYYSFVFVCFCFFFFLIKSITKDSFSQPNWSTQTYLTNCTNVTTADPKRSARAQPSVECGLGIGPTFLCGFGAKMVNGVANGWVWGGHNWVGHIKSIYPFKTHLINCF